MFGRFVSISNCICAVGFTDGVIFAGVVVASEGFLVVPVLTTEGVIVSSLLSMVVVGFKLVPAAIWFNRLPRSAVGSVFFV